MCIFDIIATNFRSCSDELGAADDDIIFEDFARLRLKGAETEA